MSEKEPIAYLGGRMIPAREAHVNVFDTAVVLGATVTDLTRTFGHKPFRLEDHTARFYNSCKYAGIDPPISAAETMAKAQQLIDHNAALIESQQDLAVVYFMSPGEFTMYAGSAPSDQPMTPTFCIHSFPLPFQVWKPTIERGAHIVTPSIRHVPPQCLDPKIKNRSRLHWWIADQQTHLVDPHAVTVLLDLDGNVTEASGANFLIVCDNTVIAPSPRNILHGISMKTVEQLCPKIGIGYEQREFQLFNVVTADEALLATTPYCLAPVTQVNGKPIGEGKPGPVFAKLMAAWSELVGMDVMKQVLTVSYP